MAYRDNVQALCEELDVTNPIEEEDLTIRELIFRTNNGNHVVEATDMNRAGRLFIEKHADRRSTLDLTSLRSQSAIFFTPDLWDDCSPERRTLVYGMKAAYAVDITYK